MQSSGKIQNCPCSEVVVNKFSESIRQIHLLSGLSRFSFHQHICRRFRKFLKRLVQLISEREWEFWSKNFQKAKFFKRRFYWNWKFFFFELNWIKIIQFWQKRNRRARLIMHLCTVHILPFPGAILYIVGIFVVKLN